MVDKDLTLPQIRVLENFPQAFGKFQPGFWRTTKLASAVGAVGYTFLDKQVSEEKFKMAKLRHESSLWTCRIKYNISINIICSFFPVSNDFNVSIHLKSWKVSPNLVNGFFPVTNVFMCPPRVLENLTSISI